ncbi:MAG: hypothetical protein ABSF23_05185 [Terracidiphilus sp.]|jgi:hypothetical protein
MSETIGPAGSISDGAFSRAYVCPDDELWLDEELLDDCAGAPTGATPANRNEETAKRRAEDRNRRIMGKPCLQV